MKKLTLALVAAMSLSTAAFADENPTPGSNGQIKFSGEVTAAGCTIVSGNNGTIDLGTISKASLKKTGNSGWTDGLLKFTDCNLTMEGSTATENTISSVDLIILPGDQEGEEGTKIWANKGKAAGVGIEVKIAGDEPAVDVTPAGTKDSIVAKINTVNDTAIYTVQGRMVKLDDNITEGSVEATLQFQASYR